MILISLYHILSLLVTFSYERLYFPLIPSKPLVGGKYDYLFIFTLPLSLKEYIRDRKARTENIRQENVFVINFLSMKVVEKFYYVCF